MFDLVIIRADTQAEVTRKSNLKLDTLLKEIAYVLPLASRNKIELEVGIRPTQS